MDRIGIMQPYVFPYIGYFQLIHSVDKFVCYDDVTFIKQGWINRNRILLNSSPHFFTIPLASASSNKEIKDTEINYNLYPKWKTKFYRTVEQAYKKSPYYSQVIPVITDVLDKKYQSISELAMESIRSVCSYVNIDREFGSCDIYNNSELNAQDRVLDICKQELATQYINVQGGRELYSKDAFSENNIELFFISPAKVEYEQNAKDFVPWLSIIDVLMYNDIQTISEKILPKYDLL